MTESRAPYAAAYATRVLCDRRTYRVTLRHGMAWIEVDGKPPRVATWAERDLAEAVEALRRVVRGETKE
jgi:hypothetical protein